MQFHSVLRAHIIHRHFTRTSLQKRSGRTIRDVHPGMAKRCSSKLNMSKRSHAPMHQRSGDGPEFQSTPSGNLQINLCT
jgi:hypothetical protein